MEEDRYIRQKEHEAYMARKEKVLKEQGKRELSALEASHKKEHDDAVKEVFGVLSLTGEKLTDEAVENFASWKLGRWRCLKEKAMFGRSIMLEMMQLECEPSSLHEKKQ